MSTLPGKLVTAGFEAGSGTSWEIRRQEHPRGRRTWHLYRSGVAIGEWDNPDAAYDEYNRHVPPRGYDMESSMGR